MPNQQEALLSVMLSPEIQDFFKVELAAEVLDRFGWARLQVQGSSMLPSIRPGDEIELRQAASHEIKIGDVVAYRRDGRLFVHRVVERDRQELVTRGDTLPRSDAPVSVSELLGVVSAVRRGGRDVSLQNTLARRATASLFRSSHLCAVLFLKFAS